MSRIDTQKGLIAWVRSQQCCSEFIDVAAGCRRPVQCF